MLRFDKLKITTSINYVKTVNWEKLDPEKMKETYKSDALYQRTYRQTTPCMLDIQINYGNKHRFHANEIVFEFTGKIFAACGICGLIDKDNFHSVVTIIQQIVEFNDDFNPQNDFEVLQCDVTQEYVNMKALKQYANAHLSNFDKWKCTKHAGNGFTLANTATTGNRKHRISIYHKGKELKMKKQHDYVQMMNKTAFADNSGGILQHYANTIRIELNINTQKQIRELLKIADNRICSVLCSDANPIRAVLDEALAPVKEPAETKPKNYKEYLINKVLQTCNNDLCRVEAEIRSVYSKHTQISKIMKPYRIYYEKMLGPEEKGMDIRQLIDDNK